MSTETYAIIKTGGKQYRVSKNDIIDVEMLDAEPGAQVEFSDVLFVQDGKKTQVGTPTISGCTVQGEMLAIAPGVKVTSMKYKKRKNQHTKWGHRQKYSRVKIIGIGESSTPKAASKKTTTTA